MAKQVFRTALTEMLGIRHPVICGGMHYVGYGGLAAAVSSAGGLGIITALTQPDPESLRKEIRECRKLTNAPFGVNLTLLPMLVPPDYGAYADVVVEEGIKVVETAGHYKGLEPFVKLFKEHDIKVIHKCTAVRHAKTAERLGVDMICMDGFEAAGHPGESDIGNWVLLTKAAKELKIPFIACGGNATGSQLAAALSLGAAGITMGTRFMVVKEAPIHQNIKQAIIDADENSTALIMRTMRNTERVYRNKAVERFMKIEQAHPGDFERVKHLISGKIYKKVFQETGNIDEGVWSAGVVMGLIDNEPSCEELITTVVNDAKESIEKVNKCLI